MKLTLKLGEETRTLRVLRRGDQLRVSFEDGRTVEMRLLSSGSASFELEKDRQRIHGAGAKLGAEARQLWVNGRSLSYQRLQAGGAAGAKSEDEAGLSVGIPAVVVEILVEPGAPGGSGREAHPARVDEDDPADQRTAGGHPQEHPLRAGPIGGAGSTPGRDRLRR